MISIKQQNALPGGENDQLRLLVTHNADGIIVVDTEGQVRFVNPAGEALLGRTADQLLGRHFGFPVVANGGAEIEILRSNGDILIVEMRAVHLVWDQTSAYLISLRDVTKNKRIEAALRDAEAFNWAILNALGNHIAVLNHDGTIIAVNDAWRGFARENGDPELVATGIGINYFGVCSQANGTCSEEAPQALEGMRAVLSNEIPFFELEYPCHAPHEERWFLLRAVPLHSQQGGIVVSHTNITVQRRNAAIAAEAEALLAQRRDQEREIAAVSQIATPGNYGTLRELEPLRQRDAERFQSSVTTYGSLLEAALQRRAFRDDDSERPGIRLLAELLGQAQAAPRDIIAIHLAALRKLSSNANQARIQVYLEEGRILVLELMGHLATYYRSRAIGG